MPRQSAAGLVAGALAATAANGAIAVETPYPVETDIVISEWDAVTDLALSGAMDDSLPEVIEMAPDGDQWVDPIDLAQTWGGGGGSDGVFAPRQGGGQKLGPRTGKGPTIGGGGRQGQPRQPRVQQPKPGKNRNRLRGGGRKN